MVGHVWQGGMRDGGTCGRGEGVCGRGVCMAYGQ